MPLLNAPKPKNKESVLGNAGEHPIFCTPEIGVEFVSYISRELFCYRDSERTTISNVLHH
jgi:hypothetical protein